MKRPAPALLMVLLLAACGGEEFQDLNDFVKNSGANMRGKVEPPPEIKPYEPFNYDNSAGLPDPFKPHKMEARADGLPSIHQPDLKRPKEALEEYPLDGLKMVGYLYQNNTGHAIIRSPEGKLHLVKAGNYIGQNYGQITEITETEIRIKEKIQDGTGDWSEHTASLQLAE